LDGDGEAVLHPKMVKNVSLQFLNYLIENGNRAGLDGVDLATVMPKLKNDKWIKIFQELNNSLLKYKINPNNNLKTNVMEGSNTEGTYLNRSPFRLFYSLHETDDLERSKIIPNAMAHKYAILKLKEYSQNNKYNLLFPYIFLDGANDSDEKIEGAEDFPTNNKITDFEFRILRHNASK